MGSDGNQTGQITIETVRKAITGVQIKKNGELYTSYEPEECRDAIEAIRDNCAEFKKLLWDQLSALPLTKKFFGRLIRVRLKQKDILDSPIVSAIVDDQRRLEHRLENIQYIPGIEEIPKEYRGCSDHDRGNITDGAIVDLHAEILVLDFLVQLGFSGICKIPKQNSRAHVDIVAQKEGKLYAIEVTRKKEIEGWKPLAYGNLEDCRDPTNQNTIRNLLRNALSSKEDQFSRSLDVNTIDCTMTKVVAIKTSDFGFAECIDQAEQIARDLLAGSNNWSHIDCIWLVPNIEVGQSRWVCRETADRV